MALVYLFLYLILLVTIMGTKTLKVNFSVTWNVKGSLFIFLKQARIGQFVESVQSNWACAESEEVGKNNLHWKGKEEKWPWEKITINHKYISHFVIDNFIFAVQNPQLYKIILFTLLLSKWFKYINVSVKRFSKRLVLLKIICRL